MPYDKRHGGPWDRGAADAYYQRPYCPHYYVAATYQSERRDVLTRAEREAYRAGWDDTESAGDFKAYTALAPNQET